MYCAASSTADSIIPCSISGLDDGKHCLVGSGMCAGYLIGTGLTDGGITEGYYDPTTGMLIAFVNGNPRKCIAGPSEGFTEPDLNGCMVRFSHCIDAGTD